MSNSKNSWDKNKLPIIEVSDDEMKTIFFPMLYSAFYRIYVAAHSGFFTMVLAYLVYLYFLAGLRAKPIYMLFLGFDITKYVFLFVSILLVILCGYFFQRHKIFSEFLLKFETRVKIKGSDKRLRDLYLDDLYPSKNILNRFIFRMAEKGRLRKNYTVEDMIGACVVIFLLLISIFVIFQV